MDTLFEMHTNIFVTSAKHNAFVNAEDVSSGKTVRPTSTGQITQYRRLTVWFVFVRLSSIASIESNLNTSSS